MKFSPSQLLACLPVAHDGVWWVALSGGLDSCVLLHALAALNLPVKLQALHVNHQISANANNWQAHCANLCAQLNVPFTAVLVDVNNTGRGLEDAARQARYEVFEDHVHAGDYLFTAHHADDQTETLLLRLMRGTGPKGLAVMARSRTLAAGRLHRPLLDFTRQALEDYASAHQLVWVDDESNSNDHYDRNYLRNQVMPLLRERWPQFAQKWQQTAELCAANELLITDLAAQDLSAAYLTDELIGTSIDLTLLVNLSVARRQNLLRHWLQGQGLSIPEQIHLNQIEQQVIGARQDAETQINWADVSLRIYQHRLFALPQTQLPKAPLGTEQIPFVVDADADTETHIALPTGASLHLQLQSAGELPLLKTDLPDLHVRFRQGGERCKPLGRRHSQTLKRLLQEYCIAPWLRESLPLIYSGEDLVAVADLWVCEEFQAEAKGLKVRYAYKT